MPIGGSSGGSSGGGYTPLETGREPGARLARRRPPTTQSRARRTAAAGPASDFATGERRQQIPRLRTSRRTTGGQSFECFGHEVHRNDVAVSDVPFGIDVVDVRGPLLSRQVAAWETIRRTSNGRRRLRRIPWRPPGARRSRPRLSRPRRSSFLAHLWPLVEAGQGTWRMAESHLSARAPGSRSSNVTKRDYRRGGASAEMRSAGLFGDTQWSTSATILVLSPQPVLVL